MADHYYAVAVIGPDRPALLSDIVASLTPQVFEQTGDPTFVMLPGGNVAIVLSVRSTAGPQQMRAALAPIDVNGHAVHVEELAERTADPHEGAKYILRIRTQGRPGVLAEFTKIVARYDGMLMDFGTKIGGDRVSVLRVELPDDDLRTVTALTHDLYSAAEQMGIGIKFYDTATGENPV